MIGNAVSKITTATDKDVKWWLSEIDRGIKYRKPFLEKWKLNSEFENMQQWNDNGKGYRNGEGDEPTINKMGSYLRTRRAVLGYNDPRAKCIPKTNDGYEPLQVPVLGENGTPKTDPQTGQVIVKPVLKYKVREELINSIVSSPMFGLTETMTRVLKAGDMSYGTLKVGYSPTFSTPPEPEGKQTIPLKDGRLDLSGFQMNKVDGAPIMNEKGTELISRETIPVWEDWFIDQVPYTRIIVDPDCEADTAQLRWIVEEEIRPLADVKADPLFKNTKDLKGTGDDRFAEGREINPELYDSEEIREKHARVRLFHIWDRVNDKYLVLGDGHGKWLRNGKTPRGVYEDPFAFYRNNEQEGVWYQRANCTDLIPIAMQYNMAYQMLMRAMGKSTGKVFMDQRVLDTVNKDKFLNNEHNALIGVDLKKMNAPLAQSILPYTPAPVSETLYASLARIEKDFWEVAGMPPEAVGSPKSETATQAQIMNKYHGTRIQVDRKAFANCLRVIFKKLDDSLDENMTQPRAVALMGTDGQAFTGLIDPAEIVGDFEVDVDVEEMGPKDDAMQASQWIQSTQVVSTAPWLVADPVLAEMFCELMNIKNPRYVEALSNAAQMNIQMMQQQAMASAQPSSPESAPPTSEAEAIQQRGAGGQVPRGSSAT